VVVSSLYLKANMRKTPHNERSTKWLRWQRRLPSNGDTNLQFIIEYFKN